MTSVLSSQVGMANFSKNSHQSECSRLTCHRVPPNVKFEVDDVESEWTYGSPFDYIFCRYMVVCILDWPKLTKNIFECVSFIRFRPRRRS